MMASVKVVDLLTCVLSLRLCVCAALSSRYLAEQFPSAGRVVGVDLSPYMLLTGRFMQQEDEVRFLFLA